MVSFVTFVPTPYEEIDAFFALAPVSANDVIYDLGSGDGRLLFAALEKGAGKAVGIELDPDLVQAARETAKEKGLENRVSFIQADVLGVDLSTATVVVCYLITAASVALKPKFEAELKPGTRVVMESFPIRGWQPDNLIILDWGFKTLFLYRMPPVPGDEGNAPPSLHVMS
jgi:SAM-dependent methyltransferase